MGMKLALGLLGLSLCQAGCIVVARGDGTARYSPPSLVTLCGPRPSPQIIEELVRAECGGNANIELRCSAPVRLRITDPGGVAVHGWHVTVRVITRSGPGLAPVVGEELGYIIHGRKHGFAIVAHAVRGALVGAATQLAWHRRDLVAIDNNLALIHRQREMQHQLDEQRRRIEAQERVIAEQHEKELERRRRLQEELERKRHQRELARQDRERQAEAARKLVERNREWKVMTTRPTDKEREVADCGPPPKNAEQIIRGYLAGVLKHHDKRGKGNPHKPDITIYEPSRTWGRVQGSSELAWGWSVRVRVRLKEDKGRPRTDYYYFMFRGEEIVSTKRVGLGYSLSAKPPR